MPLSPCFASRVLVTVFLLAGAGACAQERPAAPDSAALDSGCVPGGDGALEAAMRGAVVADLKWKNAQMECDGGPRPDGHGLRVSIAGPLASAAGAPAEKVRFIFGIDLRDSASGVAQALPTNLTVIVASGQQVYATRGDNNCAVESLQRTPLPADGGRFDRVRVRGYCIGPAADLAGTTRLLVPTFSFTAVVRNGDDP